VAGSFLPASILQRKKRGFASDVDGWFRRSLSGRMNAVFSDSGALIYKYLQRPQVVNLLQDHRMRKADNSKILFSLVLLENVLRRYAG
jgi:asparagine synthase (glutamine-hydrolysing)